jgi:hypothetical protein
VFFSVCWGVCIAAAHAVINGVEYGGGGNLLCFGNL